VLKLGLWGKVVVHFFFADCKLVTCYFQCNAGLNSRERQLSLEQTQKMVLFDFSDESDNHDVSVYDNFGAVYRNYWRDNVNQSLVYLSRDESPPEPSHSRELMAAERYSAYSGCDHY